MASKDMSKIQETVDVEVPVSTAYNQWTQFEDFPHFMEGVEAVEQLDDTHLHWKAEIGGKEVEWNAEITEQVPDKRIAWKSTSGARNAGVVTFHRLTDNSCADRSAARLRAGGRGRERRRLPRRRRAARPRRSRRASRSSSRSAASRPVPGAARVRPEAKAADARSVYKLGAFPELKRWREPRHAACSTRRAAGD